MKIRGNYEFYRNQVYRAIKSVNEYINDSQSWSELTCKYCVEISFEGFARGGFGGEILADRTEGMVEFIELNDLDIIRIKKRYGYIDDSTKVLYASYCLAQILCKVLKVDEVDKKIDYIIKNRK